MICPRCRAYNDDVNAFCVSCGETFYRSSEPGPTVMAPGGFGVPSADSNPSQPTIIHGSLPPQVQPVQPVQPTNPQPDFQSSFAAFQQSFPAIPPGGAEPRQKSRAGLLIAVAALGVFILIGGIAAAVFLIDLKPKSSEALPTSLGMYFQSSDKKNVTEIKKFDFKDGVAARDKLKDETPVTLDPKPNIILYSDGKDIPVSDLRLIETESIKDDGSLKQIEFKAATVEGKPEMKRIWLTEDLAPGKYSFVLFDGYFEDGKHRFWPFEVKSGNKKDNGDLAKSQTIERKSKAASPTPTPKTEKTPEPEKKVEPPPNSTVAYANTANVVLRSGPSQSSSKVGTIAKGQKLFIIKYSDNWEWFVTRDGREIESNYAYVQTENGKRGWVFAAFIQ